MTSPESTGMVERVALAEHWQKQCNRYVNGHCHNRRCLVRGGWVEGPVDYSLATCEEHETATMLAAIHDQDGLRDAGTPIYYVNEDVPNHPVRMAATVVGDVEGWIEIEFGDCSRAVVRPSRITRRSQQGRR